MKRTIVAMLLAVLVIGTAACQTGELGGASQTGRQNIRGIAIDYAGSNAALDVDQRGTGNELIVRDAQTPVAVIADGGAMSLYSPKNQHKLLIKAASTQSTPPFIVQNSSATQVASIDKDGALTVASLTGPIDLNGGTLTVDADADTTIAEASDDTISLTSGAATGLWNILTGNLKVGNGTPGVTLNGEDAYVEGTLEVDGAIQFDGALTAAGGATFATADLNGTALTVDADADTTIAATVDDILEATLGAAAGYFSVLTGNLRIGNGTPSVTQDGEDLYVEGSSEFDGVALFDGGLDLNGHTALLDANQSSSMAAGTNGIVNVTVPATGTFGVSAGNLKVGSGSPTVSLDGEDAYVTGTFEADGAARFDAAVVNNSTTQLVGAVNLDGAVDLDGVVTNAANLEHILWPTVATASFTYTAAAGGTVPLFTVGAGETWLVLDVRVNVTENFDATGDDATVVIGDGDDTDGFCTLADAELQTTDTEGTGWQAGWQCQVAATRGVYIDGTGGFIYYDSETIDAVIDESSGETLAGGAATVYLVYIRLN
jgi:hypothetical protein